MALLLFIPAGTLNYWQAWLYLAVVTGASTLVTIDLMQRDRALLERRLTAGPSAEQDPVQRTILRVAAVAFVALLALPGIEQRPTLSNPPLTAVIAGNVLVAFGFAIIARVYRENTFTSATVHVAEQQQLISSGPYSIVRHPMYLGIMSCLAGTPLALTSYWAAIPAVVLLLLMIWRTLNEERVLAAQLPGYIEYMQRVCYRLVPRIW